MWRSPLLCVALFLGLAHGVLGQSGTGPIFIVRPSDTWYDTASNIQYVTLRCTAEGDLPITYRWLKGGEELDVDGDNRLELAGGHLTINNPEIERDNGEYVCMATNDVGTIRSLPAKLEFAYVNAYDPDATQNVELTAGEGQCLDCRPPEHNPAISVTWTQGISPISPSRRIRVMEDGRLCFAYAVLADAGVYQCHVRSATNSPYSSGAKISPDITVTVNEVSNPNVATRINAANSPRDVVAIAGEDVTFECFAFGRIGESETPTINWLRTTPPGASLPPGFSQMDGGEVLSLRNVQAGHAGTYECTAGTVRESATLEVVEPPAWLTEPHGAQRDINTDFSWTVEASGDGVNYVWYRNGEELSSPPPGRHVFTNNYRTLTITDLLVEDTAMYQCFAKNQHKMLYSAAQLNVRAFAPQFIRSMDRDQPAPLGSTVTVECPVDGAPKPTIQWSHEGMTITGDAHYDLSSKPPNLVIVGVQYSDAGVYRCSASNSYGVDADSGTLAIKDATMITTPPQNTVVEVGASQVLQCEASHDPSLELTYVWEHNGEQIDLREVERYRMPHRGKGDLELVEATTDDSGSYTCVALTVADSATRTAQVDITGPPGPPFGLSVTVTGRSAELSWTPGSPNHSPITSFTVEGKTSYDTEWTELRSAVAAGSNSVRITNLEAFSLYTFRVYAVNAIGSGPPSDPVEASTMTSKSPPETYPQNVGGGGGNEGDLRITWDTFPMSEWNSDVVWYMVEWQRVQSQMTSRGRTNQSNAVVFVATDDIALYTEYNVRVQAANDISTGPWSPWVKIRSYQEAPNSAPTSVSAKGTSASSLEVTWTGIDTSGFQGELMGYKLTYWSSDSDRNNAQTEMSPGTRESISGLEANMRYTVIVQAYSGGGDGPESNSVVESTLKQAPQRQPGDVRALVSGTDITVTWSPITTSSSEEALQGYKVRYRRTGVFEEDAETIDVQGSATTATIRGLDAGNTYLITVQGYSAGGLGAMSDPPVTITTEKAKVGQSSDGGGDGGGGASKTVGDLSLTVLLLAALIHAVITHL